MVAAARRPAMPVRVYLYVGAVVLTMALLLPLSGLAEGAAHGYVAAFDALLLTVLIALAYWRPMEIGPKRKVNVGTAAEVAAVLLLPGPFAVLTLAAGSLAGEAPRHVRLVQRVFNTALAMLRAAVGTSLHASLQRLGPAAFADVAATLATPSAMYLCTLVLIRGIVAVQLRQNPLSRTALPPRELVVAEVALSLTGIMAALAAADHAWTLLLLVAPIALADRAVRNTVALREQTRVAEGALAETEAALATRDEFLSLASHELRTPLTVLTGNTQLLARRLARGGGTPEAGQLVRQSERQIDRLAKLVDTLLDVSRIKGGTFEVELEPVSLGAVLRRVLELQQATSTPPRPIELSVPETTPIVEADADRLEQVLVNLVDNACKYSPPAKPIHITVGVTGEAVSVAVRDEGIGIPASEQGQIFSRFRRGSNVDGGTTGLGLGLYIVDELVRAQGGQLTCESEQGRGSTFTVTLPKYDAVTEGNGRLD